MKKYIFLLKFCKHLFIHFIIITVLFLLWGNLLPGIMLSLPVWKFDNKNANFYALSYI